MILKGLIILLTFRTFIDVSAQSWNSRDKRSPQYSNWLPPPPHNGWRSPRDHDSKPPPSDYYDRPPPPPPDHYAKRFPHEPWQNMPPRHIFDPPDDRRFAGGPSGPPEYPGHGNHGPPDYRDRPPPPPPPERGGPPRNYEKIPYQAGEPDYGRNGPPNHELPNRNAFTINIELGKTNNAQSIPEKPIKKEENISDNSKPKLQENQEVVTTPPVLSEVNDDSNNLSNGDGEGSIIENKNLSATDINTNTTRANSTNNNYVKPIYAYPFFFQARAVTPAA
ncbi:uncharacterized protein [Epargyreus clarus]|uniref:uncharacterized protein isoform X3 n=1 Tax=Epargyreus clarus TaxID=520877 RepID=UPI003C2DC5A1